MQGPVPKGCMLVWSHTTSGPCWDRHGRGKLALVRRTTSPCSRLARVNSRYKPWPYVPFQRRLLLFPASYHGAVAQGCSYEPLCHRPCRLVYVERLSLPELNEGILVFVAFGGFLFGYGTKSSFIWAILITHITPKTLVSFPCVPHDVYYVSRAYLARRDV